MNTLPTTAELIAQAQDWVRRGATITLDFGNGQHPSVHPVALLALTERTLSFLVTTDEQEHGFQVKGIKAGDDGQVIVEGDDRTATIWGTTTITEGDALDWWLHGARTRRGPWQLGVGPEPPDIVEYAGHVAQDVWRRYRGTPGRSCIVRVIELDGATAHGVIEEVEREVGPEQANLDFAPESVPADWQPLRRGDRLTAYVHRHEGKTSRSPWGITWGMSRIRE